MCLDAALGWRNYRHLTARASFPVPTSVCLWAGAIAPLLFVPLLILAGRATPGYGHMASTFSDASAQGSPRPEFMTAGLTLVSICLLLAGFGLARSMPRHGRLVQCGLFVSALSILQTAVFRDYNRSPWVPRNREGLLHNTFAIVAIFAILIAILTVVLAVRSDSAWAHLSMPGLTVLTIIALAGFAFTWGPDSHDGLAERFLAGAAFSYLSWVSLTALAVLRGVSLREAWLQRSAETLPATAPVGLDD